MLSCELLPSGYKRFVWLLTILHLLESNSLFYFSKTWKLLFIIFRNCKTQFGNIYIISQNNVIWKNQLNKASEAADSFNIFFKPPFQLLQ